MDKDHTIISAASHGPFCKKSFAEVGSDVWKHLYKESTGDDDAYERLNDSLREFIHNPSVIIHPELMQKLLSPDNIMGIMGAARWVDQGMPVIRLGHRRLGALMATSVPPEMAEDVKPPFKAFFIELPPGMLQIKEGVNDSMVDCQGVMVWAAQYDREVSFHLPKERIGQQLWSWMAVTGKPLIQWQLHRTTRELIEHRELGDVVNDWDAFGFELGDYDNRVTVLINRLICSTCLLMTSKPEDFVEKRERPGVKVKGKKPRKKDAPEFRVFVNTKPITVDVRPALRAFLGGHGGGPPTKQVLVRGHWKRQPYGPRHSLRKRIWLEPFWRGPEDGLISSRTYTSETLEETGE